MKLDCNRYRMRAMALEDGEGAMADHEAVAAHLAACADCRGEMEDLRTVSHLLSAQRRFAVPERDWHWKDTTASQEAPAARSPWSVSGNSLVAAAMLGGVTLIFLYLVFGLSSNLRQAMPQDEPIHRYSPAEENDPPPQAKEDAQHATVEKLIAALGDEDFKSREQASEALRALGEAATPQLRAALVAAQDPEVKRRISALLAPFGTMPRVLMAGTDNLECRHLHNLLASSEQVAVDAFTIQDNGSFALKHFGGKGGYDSFLAERAHLAVYDAIVLGDVDPKAIGRERMTWIADFVRQGGALLVIAGEKYMPRAYAETPLAGVLPIVIGADKPLSGNFKVSPTPAGAVHPVLQGRDGGAMSKELLEKLPAFPTIFPCAAKRKAVTLLEAADGENPSHPVVVLGRVEKGSAVYLGLDSLWRFREQEEGKRIYDRFYQGLLTYLGSGHAARQERRFE